MVEVSINGQQVDSIVAYGVVVLLPPSKLGEVLVFHLTTAYFREPTGIISSPPAHTLATEIWVLDGAESELFSLGLTWRG